MQHGRKKEKKKGSVPGSWRRKSAVTAPNRYGKSKVANTALDERRSAKSIRKRKLGEPRNELQTRLVEAIEKYSELDRHGQPPVRSLSHRPGSGSARLD